MNKFRLFLLFKKIIVISDFTLTELKKVYLSSIYYILERMNSEVFSASKDWSDKYCDRNIKFKDFFFQKLSILMILVWEKAW